MPSGNFREQGDMLNKGKPEAEVRTEYIAAAAADDDDYKEEEE